MIQQHGQGTHHSVRFDTPAVILPFAQLIVVLVLAHLLSQIAKFRFGIPGAYGLVDHVEQHGMENLTMGIFVLFEESLEKIGILIFLSGILDHLRTTIGRVAIDVVDGSKALPVA